MSYFNVVGGELYYIKDKYHKIRWKAMPSLKHINSKGKAPKARHSKSKQHNKLSISIEKVDDQHDMLRVDLQNATKDGNETKLKELLTKAKNDNALKGLFFRNATTEENILHIASKYGNHRIVKMLLDAAKNINDNDHTLTHLLLSTNKSKENALRIAAAGNNYMTVIELLSSAENINDDNQTLIHLLLSTNQSGENALHIATSNNQRMTVIKLLRSAENINDGDKTLTHLLLSTNKLKENAFHIAAANDNYTMVVDLLSSAKYINDINKTLAKLLLSITDSGRTALHLSTVVGSISVVLEILNYAKLVNDKNQTLTMVILSYDRLGVTALHLAALYGHTMVATKLLDAAKLVGKNTLEDLLLRLDNNRDNALHITSLNGYVQIAAKLLDFAESISIDTARRLILATNKLDKNILHISAEGNKYHADALMTNLLNIAGNLSINEYGHQDNVLQKLFSAYTKSGESPLHIAAHNQNVKIIIALFNAMKNMQSGTSILKDLLFHTDDFGTNPLYISISNQNPQIFTIILDTIRNIDNLTVKHLLLRSTKSHDSVLHTLVSKNKVRLVEYLLEKIENHDWHRERDATKDLGRYIDVPEELKLCDINNAGSIKCHNGTELGPDIGEESNVNPTGISSIKCDSDAELNKIKLTTVIKCFNINMWNTVKSVPSASLKKVENDNANECIRKAGCVNNAKYTNADNCAKATNYIVDKNNMISTFFLFSNKLGYKPLHLAVLNGYHDMVQKLLEVAKHFDTWKRDAIKQYIDIDKCLTVTIDHSHVIPVETVLKEITSKNNDMLTNCLFSITRLDGDNVLHIAARVKDTQIVDKLLSCAAQNVGDNNATFGVIELLLSTNKLGETALHIAAQVKDTQVVNKLLSYAQNVGDNNATLVQLLLSNNKLGETALHIAAGIHDIQVVDELLSYAQNVGDNNATLVQLLLSNNKLGETVMCKAHNANTTDSSTTVDLILDAAERAGIMQTLVNINCTIDNDSVNNHEYYVDSNSTIRIKRDIKHELKGITHHYDSDNTQGTIIPALTKNLKFNTLKSIPHSTDNYNTATNQVAISDFNVGGMLMFLYYFFPNQSAFGTHYISPHTQHTIQLDEIASKVDQLLLGELVPGNN